MRKARSNNRGADACGWAEAVKKTADRPTEKTYTERKGGRRLIETSARNTGLTNAHSRLGSSSNADGKGQ